MLVVSEKRINNKKIFLLPDSKIYSSFTSIQNDSFTIV